MTARTIEGFLNYLRLKSGWNRADMLKDIATAIEMVIPKEDMQTEVSFTDSHSSHGEDGVLYTECIWKITGYPLENMEVTSINDSACGNVPTKIIKIEDGFIIRSLMSQNTILAVS